MILFSPLGNTDPIRDFYDGACLHIIRHYRDKGLNRVVLFFTAEMEEKQDKYQPYTEAIEKVAPNLPVEKIYTGITDAHLYDSFINILPRSIYKLHERFPDEEIILNVSSGTPQMKNILALIGIEENWCRAVQVSSPSNASNLTVPNVSDVDDFNYMLENNLDNNSDAKNRCIEPPFRVLRLYIDKNKIVSLIKQYEYTAALNIARQNPNIPDVVKKLLEHAVLRMKLMPDSAIKIIDKYDDVRLCPFTGTQRLLMEYFLTMQIDKAVGNLSGLLIKTVPFMYEFMLEYVLRDETLNIKKSCSGRDKKLELQRQLLSRNNPALLSFLDKKFNEPFRSSPLSQLILTYICEFAAENSADETLRGFYAEILRKMQSIPDRVILLRNNVAHIITDVDEEKFFGETGMHSDDLVRNFFEMLTLMYGDEIKKQRGFYNNLNRWVEAAMES